MSSDVDTRISRLLDQLMNPSLSPDQVSAIYDRINLLQGQA